MVGHLSYKQFTQVRFLQLRFCFSGATEAQLFRNQQAVGSVYAPLRSAQSQRPLDIVRPTGSFYASIA